MPPSLSMTAPRIQVWDPQAYICETSPGFYSNNRFQIHDPEVGLKWLANMTKRNAKELRYLYCSIHAVYNPGPYPDFLTNRPPNGPIWCRFIRALSAKASDLEEVTFYLDSEPTCHHWGPAVDPNFVRALGCMSQLRRLQIKGYFPKEWP
jgi:hypothetical protein